MCVAPESNFDNKVIEKMHFFHKTRFVTFRCFLFVYCRLDDIYDDEDEDEDDDEEDSGFGQYNTSEILPKVIVSPNMKSNNVNHHHNLQQNVHLASSYNSNSNNITNTSTRPLLNQHYGEKRKNRILSLQQINFDPAIA